MNMPSSCSQAWWKDRSVWDGRTPPRECIRAQKGQGLSRTGWKIRWKEDAAQDWTINNRLSMALKTTCASRGVPVRGLEAVHEGLANGWVLGSGVRQIQRKGQEEKGHTQDLGRWAKGGSQGPHVCD